MKLFVLLALFVFTAVDPSAAQLQKIRVANGGFGTAINAVLPAAYHKKIYQLASSGFRVNHRGGAADAE